MTNKDNDEGERERKDIGEDVLTQKRCVGGFRMQL